jgi:hypothetical protein
MQARTGLKTVMVLTVSLPPAAGDTRFAQADARDFTSSIYKNHDKTAWVCRVSKWEAEANLIFPGFSNREKRMKYL